MKKTLALLLAAAVILSLAACGTQQSQNSPAAEAADESPATAEKDENGASQENIAQPEEPGSPETQDAGETGKTALIVYFSPANSDTIDAVSSATSSIDGVSSVEYVARLIGAKVDADMAKIVPETAYPLPYNDTADQAKQERDDGARPAFALDADPEAYDTVFIGYPVWWYEMPMIMQTFFETYDLSGKTIVPFNTHEGSGDGGTYADIAELEPDAVVLDGLAVTGRRAGDAGSDVDEWLTKLGF